MPDSTSYKEILQALMNYCDYQERCSFEVEKKLKGFDISEEEKGKVIQALKELNYLNDERYVHSFVRGKHGLKAWGKIKIKSALYQKKIRSSMIDKAFDEVLQEDDYQEKLIGLFEKKWSLLNKKNDRKTIQKIYRYLYSKGYEGSLITQLINERIKI